MEKVDLKAPLQEDAVRWVSAINNMLRESMACELRQEAICGLKVLRIHTDGASMEVRTRT